MCKTTLKGKVPNDNTMECKNGDVRDYENVMDGHKRKRTPILLGYQITTTRPHEELNGKISAEACGVWVGGRTNGKL